MANEMYIDFSNADKAMDSATLMKSATGKALGDLKGMAESLDVAIEKMEKRKEGLAKERDALRESLTEAEKDGEELRKESKTIKAEVGSLQMFYDYRKRSEERETKFGKLLKLKKRIDGFARKLETFSEKATTCEKKFSQLKASIEEGLKNVVYWLSWTPYGLLASVIILLVAIGLAVASFATGNSVELPIGAMSTAAVALGLLSGFWAKHSELNALELDFSNFHAQLDRSARRVESLKSVTNDSKQQANSALQNVNMELLFFGRGSATSFVHATASGLGIGAAGAAGGGLPPVY